MLSTPQSHTCVFCRDVQVVFYTNVEGMHKMLDLDEIKAHLQYMVLSRVAYETGVDRGTLIRLSNGVTKNPSHSVVVALSKFLLSIRND